MWPVHQGPQVFTASARFSPMGRHRKIPPAGATECASEGNVWWFPAFLLDVRIPWRRINLLSFSFLSPVPPWRREVGASSCDSQLALKFLAERRCHSGDSQSAGVSCPNCFRILSLSAGHGNAGDAPLVTQCFRMTLSYRLAMRSQPMSRLSINRNRKSKDIPLYLRMPPSPLLPRRLQLSRPRVGRSRHPFRAHQIPNGPSKANQLFVGH
jgi:hypothetical protein